jgi:hypothetical protein
MPVLRGPVGTLFVVGGGVGSGVTGPQHHCGRFAGAVGAVVDEREQRVETKPFLNVGAAFSLSECASSRLASRSEPH